MSIHLLNVLLITRLQGEWIKFNEKEHWVEIK